MEHLYTSYLTLEQIEIILDELCGTEEDNLSDSLLDTIGRQPMSSSERHKVRLSREQIEIILDELGKSLVRVNQWARDWKHDLALAQSLQGIISELKSTIGKH